MAKDSFWEKYRDRRWQEKRLRIMNRAEFCCEMCGSADNATQLHIHHGYYRSKADPWDYPDDTLWCVCEACHDRAGELKHDCQLELAQINPAFLDAVLSVIVGLRDGFGIYGSIVDRKETDYYTALSILLGGHRSIEDVVRFVRKFYRDPAE